MYSRDIVPDMATQCPTNPGPDSSTLTHIEKYLLTQLWVGFAFIIRMVSLNKSHGFAP